MYVVSKKDSIYFQLLKLLLCSAVMVVLLFVGMNFISNYTIDYYYYNTNYSEKKDAEYIEKLQKYIDRNAISSRDTANLKAWVKKQNILTLKIYKDHIKVFDSDYPDKEIWEENIEANEYEWETYYSVEFADGMARVGIIGWYGYKSYNYALVAEIVVSFVLFFILVLLGIRRKMKYISKLCDEIGILEGGNLDYAITIKGNDELAALAEGLNSMRLSFQEMIEQEAEIVSENSKIITEMSHDLRTPVTSIMLYTEILKKGSYKDENKLLEYLEKIDRKSHRMKQLADHLFEYSMVSGGKEIELEPAESCEVRFYDLLSETCGYLMQEGFDVDFRVEWKDRNIRVYTEYIVRIIDNITSNITKYADPRHKVVISSLYTSHMAGFVFENAERELEEKQDSNVVGIQSIKNMMRKMGGDFRVAQKNGRFRIEILFPCVEGNEFRFIKKQFRIW